MADLDQSKLYFGDGEQIWTQSDIDDLYRDLTDIVRGFKPDEVYFFFYLMILKNEGLLNEFHDLLKEYQIKSSPEFTEIEHFICKKITERLSNQEGPFYDTL